MMASRLAWFATPVGKKTSFGIMTGTSIATFALLYSPQTILLSKYQDIVSMYHAAQPVSVSDRLMKLWNETLTTLNLPEYQAVYLQPFTVFGFDLFRAGTTQTRTGAIIGLPINFTYTDVGSVDATRIRVNNESVNWNRQDAKQLLESLILSDDAKRYGMAREMLMARYNAPLISASVASFMVSSTYILCRGMNNRWQLLQRPFAVRGCFYLLSGLLGFLVWATQNDTYNTYREKETDEYLAQLDESYTTGAIEFYTKLLKKNVALRSLMGSEGESLYTPVGNERFLFRQPRLPIEKRKKFFEKALAERTKQVAMANEEFLSETPLNSDNKPEP